MPLSVEVAKTTFAAGEVSPELRARSDLAKAQTGCWFLENMVVLLEGGVTRAPGTQMVLQLNAAHAYVPIPFRFSGSGSNAYLIVIGGGVAQFILGNAVVVIGGGNNNPYQVAVPYTDADLGGAGATVAGVSNLRWAISGNAVFLFCDGHAPQLLTRNADNSWTLTPYLTAPSVPVPQGGCLAPVDTENFDPLQTITATAAFGTVTLNATAAFAAAAGTVPNGFQQGHVGSIWRLDESDLSLTVEWTIDETITVPVSALPAAAGYFGSMTNAAGPFGGGGDATQTATTQFYIGASFAAAQSVQAVTIVADNTTGFTDTFLPSSFSEGGVPVTFRIFGKNGAPANATDGALLGTGTVTDGVSASITIATTDPLSTFDHISVVGNVVTAAPITVASIGWNQYTAGAGPVLRRFNGNVYQALSSGSSGANAPVHTSGTVFSGIGGVQWQYVHRDRGFVQIAAVASPAQATAIVTERLPDSVVVKPTQGWWPSAWDAIKGWPDRAMVENGALITGRQNRAWQTQPGSFFNYDIVDPTSAQSALAFGLVSPSGSLAWIEAFYKKEFLMALTRDEEWTIAGGDPFSPITVENLSPYPSGQKGSAVHIPATAEGGLITISRSRARAFYHALAFNGVMPAVTSEELTVSARHILGQRGGGALGVSRQEDPNCINWIWCANGLLVGNTLMREQQINGWHRHPQHAGTSSVVQGVATIPSNDEGVSWTYFQTMRTINGAPAKFIELLQPFFQPQDFDNPTAAGAWFLDCALRYQGAPATVIHGLNHLIGQAVGVHADGCMYRDADGSLPVVDGTGSITLSRATQDAIIGLPKPYRIRLLPLDLTTPKGSDAGDKQKANHLFLRLVNSAGGQVAVNPDDGGIAEAIEPAGSLTYGAPVPLRNELFRTPGLDVPLAEETIVEITSLDVCDTMPFTLIGVDPDIDVTEAD